MLACQDVELQISWPCSDLLRMAFCMQSVHTLHAQELPTKHASNLLAHMYRKIVTEKGQSRKWFKYAKCAQNSIHGHAVQHKLNITNTT